MSVNFQKYIIFLVNLRSTYSFDDILLVQDNLSAHRSIEAQERMDDLGFRYAYTPRYSPQYNGIEEVWAMSKAYIK